MIVENDNDLAGLRRIGSIVAECLQLMGNNIEPGITTRELDAIGAAFLTKHGAESAPYVVYNFPGTTCISVNNEVAHGIPSDRIIMAGDIVNVDVSARLDGYFGDTGGSFIVPPGTDIQRKVCKATKEALQEAMKVAKADQPLNLIGKAIEGVAARYQLSIIRNLGSHGVGRALHEEPGFIASFYDPNDTRILKEGMVITIEPFLSSGAKMIKESNDGWTLYTPPQFVTAQYEHTIVITKDEPLVMTIVAP